LNFVTDVGPRRNITMGCSKSKPAAVATPTPEEGAAGTASTAQPAAQTPDNKGGAGEPSQRLPDIEDCDKVWRANAVLQNRAACAAPRPCGLAHASGAGAGAARAPKRGSCPTRRRWRAQGACWYSLRRMVRCVGLCAGDLREKDARCRRGRGWQDILLVHLRPLQEAGLRATV